MLRVRRLLNRLGRNEKVVGHIDEFMNGNLKGWALNRFNDRESVFVDVYFGEVFLETLSADLPREDLVAAGYNSYKHGFSKSFLLPANTPIEGIKVVARSPTIPKDDRRPCNLIIDRTNPKILFAASEGKHPEVFDKICDLEMYSNDFAGFSSEVFATRNLKTVHRCFVIDPVCAIEFGHSLNSLNYFTQLASEQFGYVEAYASFHLPISANKDKINRFFDFYYDKFIKIKRKDMRYNGKPYLAPKDPLPHAISDFSNFLFYNNIDAQDLLLFPNVDIYSLIALLSLIEGRPEDTTPRLMLRFIGVMENAKYFERDAFDVAIQAMIRLKKRNYFISISAETPALARTLGSVLKTEVLTTPYPQVGGDAVPLPSSPFTVLCGGSARADKGFERLPRIIEIVRRLGGNDIDFIIQNAPPFQQPEFHQTLSSLHRLPNVTLLDGVLPYEKILEAYQRATISIMPYDADVYVMRGSAILMESIMFGRLVIGQAGTAFSEQILLYNGGELAETDEDFAKAIVRMSNMPRNYLWEQACAGRQRYLNDVKSSYRNWFGDMT